MKTSSVVISVVAIGGIGALVYFVLKSGVFGEIDLSGLDLGIGGSKNITPRNEDPNFSSSWVGDENAGEQVAVILDETDPYCKEGVARRLCQEQVAKGTMPQSDVTPCMAALQGGGNWMILIPGRGKTYLTRGTYALSLERDC